MRFLRPSAGWAALCFGALLACSPDRIGGPAAPEAAALGDGAPAALTASAVPALVITEFLANPAGTETEREWFEVYNAGTTAVNLKSYRFLSGVTATPESFTVATDVNVPAGGFAVFVSSPTSPVDPTYGGLPAAVISYKYPTNFILNNSNTDWIALKMPDGTLVDSIAYSARTSTGTIGTPAYTASTEGPSRQVIDPCADNGIVGGTNWFASPTTDSYGAGGRGTPGRAPTGTTSGRCDTDDPGPVVSVTVSPATARVVVGRTRAFAAAGVDADGIPSPTTYEWRSSDPAVLSIDPASGLATAQTPGTATVTARSANGVEGRADVTVTLTADVATISVGSNDGVAVQGYTRPMFINSVKDADGADVSPFPTLAWSSMDETKAVVDQRGYVTFLNPGSVAIRATAANGVFSAFTFNVVDTIPAPSSVTYRNHLEFGTPTDADASDDVIFAKRQFVSSWNAARGGPNWVSWNLNGTHFGGVARCNCFTTDPTLPASFYQVHDSDYRNGGYDRGHMVQSESRTRTFTENAATFLMTNILPQAANNNQGPWLAFENFLNTQAQSFGKDVYVVAGGIYAPDAPTLKNEGHVAIPDYTWKVAIVVPSGKRLADVTSPSDVGVFAVKLPNRVGPAGDASADDIRAKPWQDFETTVDAIETATGYDLFSLLPEPVQTLVESTQDRFPVPAIGGAHASVEGGTVTFSGSATDLDDITYDNYKGVVDYTDVVTLGWDLDGDGTFETNGASATRTFVDDGIFVVKMRATDSRGVSSVAEATVTVTNGNPVVTSLILDSAEVTSGNVVPLEGTFTDVGVAD
ncbi:MAG: DNA/RNA non-specific endonuclease, partial [Gemmatimonadaceae bacterium]